MNYDELIEQMKTIQASNFELQSLNNFKLELSEMHKVQ